jgi:hypothetical protein
MVETIVEAAARILEARGLAGLTPTPSPNVPA